MRRFIVLGVALLALAIPGRAATAQSAACTLAKWQQCPDVMLIAPFKPKQFGVGELQSISNQIIDLSEYKTAQFLQTDLPAGISTTEWHAHEFDAIVVQKTGKTRFWWLNRDTREQKSVVIDAARHPYLLIPHGVPHFVDMRGAKTGASVAEFLLSKKVWTAQEFLTHRVHVDRPFPPIIPLK